MPLPETSDDVLKLAMEAGCGLEASRAVQAMAAETRLDKARTEAVEAVDARLAELKAKAGDQLSNAEIAVLVGLDSKQRVHQRIQRHHDRVAGQ